MSPVRLLQVLVPDDQSEPVTAVLDEEGVDYTRQRSVTDGDEQWLFEIPLPADAVGPILDRLEAVGVATDRYSTILSLESARSPAQDALQERYASDFDPLRQHELRSKARDLSHDPRSFVAMIFLSAIIATAGLLVESPAVVVGSMVIAPIVGPVLTAAVGATSGDREMLVGSVSMQAVGLTVAIVAAAVFGFGIQLAGFVPASLDVASIELIALRIAPGLLTVAVGLAAGAAAAYGLMTKGPTSLIGVMIAAALIPAAATVGIAIAWQQPRIAIGSLLLLLLSMVLINIGAGVVLWAFGYRPDGSRRLLDAGERRRLALIVAAVALVVLVGVVAAASVLHIGHERTVTQAVHDTLDQPEYDTVEPVSVRIQYSGPGPYGEPETVTVTVSHHGSDGDPPAVADAIDRRVTAAVGHDVVLRVRFVDYQYAEDDVPAADGTAAAGGTARPA